MVSKTLNLLRYAHTHLAIPPKLSGRQIARIGVNDRSVAMLGGQVRITPPLLHNSDYGMNRTACTGYTWERHQTSQRILKEMSLN